MADYNTVSMLNPAWPIKPVQSESYHRSREKPSGQKIKEDKPSHEQDKEEKNANDKQRKKQRINEYA